MQELTLNVIIPRDLQRATDDYPGKVFKLIGDVAKDKQDRKEPYVLPLLALKKLSRLP